MNTLELRQAPALLPRKGPDGPPFVVFSGGKGGVGKTLLAANAAITLAKRGRKVLLVDLDLGLADLDVLLGISPTRTLEDALIGGAKLADCVVAGPGGVAVLGGSSGTLALARLDDAARAQFFESLFELARHYDLVVGDCAAGIGPEVLDACLLADHVFVVTTPEPAALTDAYGLIKALHARSLESGCDLPTPELVVNQSHSLSEAECTASKLRGVCERFLSRSPRSAGWMPSSTKVSNSAARRRPFALDPDGGLPWSCLARLANRVERLCLGPASGVGAQASVGHGR